MKIKYRLPDIDGEDWWNETQTCHEDGQSIAEQCADDYYHLCDGWECTEELPWTIVFLREGQQTPEVFSVAEDYEMSFHASKSTPKDAIATSPEPDDDIDGTPY